MEFYETLTVMIHYKHIYFIMISMRNPPKYSFTINKKVVLQNLLKLLMDMTQIVVL